MDAKEKCGLYGAFGLENASRYVYQGLFALQHRGQESAGIVSSDGADLASYKGMGLVGEVFSEEVISRLRGTAAIGHVRYSTTGSSNVNNAQPFLIKYSGGEIAVAHNGNLVNAATLRHEYEAQGSIFQTTMDTEIILHILARTHRQGGNGLIEKAIGRVQGAYSLLFITPGEMIAARDPHGFRPLCIGRVGEAWVVASETCAFDITGAQFVREVEPGEVVHFSADGIRSGRILPSGEVKPKYCIFEHIYFARPDSVIFGDSVHEVRKRLGARLAQDAPVDADMVVAIPEGGTSAALGYSEASGLPIDRGFIVNRYVGRTFIKPDAVDRAASAQAKLNVVSEVVRGKRLVVVDDSVVRGTTCRAKMALLRKAGAKEVHFRVTCPPHLYPCFYGIDFPERQELLAVRYNLEEIKEFLKVDSIAYQTLDGMLSCVSNPPDHYCHACFTGRYPVVAGQKTGKFILERTQ
ncbi:MAG: amidophosphoribosyltransferase [Planctomycetes bacterium]|nr:amidophosphoribosyltransferase [Planctomycetota bacterium]